jgi:hypothetical protein
MADDPDDPELSRLTAEAIGRTVDQHIAKVDRQIAQIKHLHAVVAACRTYLAGEHPAGEEADLCARIVDLADSKTPDLPEPDAWRITTRLLELVGSDVREILTKVQIQVALRAPDQGRVH